MMSLINNFMWYAWTNEYYDQDIIDCFAVECLTPFFHGEVPCCVVVSLSSWWESSAWLHLPTWGSLELEARSPTSQPQPSADGNSMAPLSGGHLVIVAHLKSLLFCWFSRVWTLIHFGTCTGSWAVSSEMTPGVGNPAALLAQGLCVRGLYSDCCLQLDLVGPAQCSRNLHAVVWVLPKHSQLSYPQTFKWVLRPRG